MNEININIEGFNVNGICVGCLNYNRKMFYSIKIKECFQILGNIEIPSGLVIQVCWECMAYITKICTFKDRIQRSYNILLDYSKKHTFLNSPEELSQHAINSLTKVVSSDIEEQEHVVVYVKNDDVVGDSLVKEEVFHEFDNDFNDDYDAQFDDFKPGETDGQDLQVIDVKIERDYKLDIGESSDDDIQLSKLKKKKDKKERKKDKKKSKKKKEEDHKTNRKLKNLPKNIVELINLSEEKMWEIRQKDVVDPEFVNLKYKCEDCIIGFSMSKLMEHHTKGRHTPKKKLSSQCDVCKSYFLTKDNLTVHRSLHLLGYRCKICSFETGLKRLIIKHVNDYHKQEMTDKFVCGICDKDFSTKSKLSYHKGVCLQDRPQCDCCGKVFANKMTLKYHIKAMSGEKTEVKPKEILYLPCKGCNKVFHTKKGYRAHVVIHEGLQFPCPKCGKLFQWKRNLARHIRNHSEKDTGMYYECGPCGKRFSSKDCFNNHMKLSKQHVSEDKYNHQCTYCGKKFPTKWCMVDHIDWDHLKKIKYQCQTCLKAFKTAKILVAHMNNIHGGKKNREPESEHLCEICGKSYTTVKRLKGHVWAMHTHRSTSKSYKCKLCPATFTWQTSIYKHMKIMHDNNKRNKTIPRTLSSAKKLKIEPPLYDSLELANRMQYFQNINNLQGLQNQSSIVTNMV